MPRVGFRWYCCSSRRSRFVLPRSILLASIFCCVWINAVRADCWYDGDRFEEGSEVATTEPCLNCTCNRGALLCYLRVCPKLPNPPPPGCILLHRYRTCCPELICAEFPGGGNGIESRSDPDSDVDMPYDGTIMENACISNGSIYGPGSAMDSSSFCEYCFCLGGNETCVKPKCLLPIEGCTPIYDVTNCCPIKYNCTSLDATSTTTTTTENPTTTTQTGGCWVDGEHHQEGGKVRDVGHSVCDNCYCIKGLLRCEPLSCAPPLLGCKPVIRPGECCAASYNCSGTIEIQPEPNYGQYPIMSKEYAKLRKEQTRKHPLNGHGVVTVAPFYVLPETSHTFTTKHRGPFGTTRHFTGVSFNTSTIQPDKESRTSNATNEMNKNGTSVLESRIASNKENTESSSTSLKYPDDIFGLLDLLLDDERNETSSNQYNSSDTSSELTTTPVIQTTTDFVEDNSTEETLTTTDEYEITTSSSANISIPVTVTILKSTDCYDSLEGSNMETTLNPIGAGQKEQTAIEGESTTEKDYQESTTIEETTNAKQLEKEETVTTRNIPNVRSDIEEILNITKHKHEEYDYDYNEPSLPPSLPNLRIIPFVAADALDSQKDTSKEEVVYNKRNKVSGTSFANLFSPPVETQGGFIPKDPMVIGENFYKTTIRAPIKEIEEKPIGNCLDENLLEIPHGQSVSSDSPCTTCTCFYGNIVCQKSTCPIPAVGCRKSTVQDLTLCCPLYVCDVDAVPIASDRLDNRQNPSEAATIPGQNVIPEALKDVIKTEPPPNLQSLISDMMPLLAKKTTPTFKLTEQIPETSTEPMKNSTDVKPADNFSLDKVWQLLFSEENEENTTSQIQTGTGIVKTTQSSDVPGTTTPPMQTKISTTQGTASLETRTGSSLLINLAGCNIYGRMYRVGRIISELSGPCLECKCTEIGVQCTALNC